MIKKYIFEKGRLHEPRPSFWTECDENNRTFSQRNIVDLKDVSKTIRQSHQMRAKQRARRMNKDKDKAQFSKNVADYSF